MIVVPDSVVFDAEPLIAHADDEPGSDVVEEHLDAVAVEDTAGYASCVTDDLAETISLGPATDGDPGDD